MVTGVPGEGGVLQIQLSPPKHTPQALEPKLMPIQHPEPPVCLLWGHLGLSCTLP